MEPLCQRNVGVPAIAAVFEFLREHWSRFLVISAVVLIPCFWHSHLADGDGASHLYNAWLAQLITNGQAPGLFVARQFSNVLFDLAFSGLGSLFGLALAEKIAVSAAVLIFFWGAFAFACTVSHTAYLKTIPWFLTPCLAVLAYGYTLQAGFLNYYLSIGLAFFGFALIAQCDAQSIGSVVPDGLVVLLLIPLIWLAHPLGLFVLMSGGAYILLAKLLPPGRHIYLFSAAVLLLVTLHFFLKFRRWDTPWETHNIGLMSNGADQLLLYAPHYLLPVYLLECLFLVFLLVDAMQGWRTPQWRQSYVLPVQLYGLALLAVLMLPSGISVPQRYFGAMNALIFLKDRLTSVVAVFGCCLLAQVRPRKWHYAGFAALAAIFFSYLYRDTATISHLEDQIERFATSLPFGQRVIQKLIQLPGDRVGMINIIDRACIGRCFSYGNYEASSRQFRIRMKSENPFVLSNESADAVRLGKYVVQQRDLPLYEVYQCVPDTTTLCFRELQAGQVNGRIDTSTP